MIINFKKSISWSEIFFVTLGNERQMVRRQRLHFKNKQTSFEVDLEDEKYIYFTNGKTDSEIVVLSKLIDELELIFNHKTRRYTINYSIKNHDDYGTIRTIKFKDDINLKFRRGHSKIVNIWTPSNYDENKEYGVIFMFDSQNIFDVKKFGEYTKRNDPYGGWQVESALEKCSQKYGDDYIVVGIDDSDKYRMLELMENDTNVDYKKEVLEHIDIPLNQLKKASLDSYGLFILNTLLPYLETNYKIKKYNIGICGSSAGGNASLYLGLKHPDVFRFVFTLTPAFGFYTDESLVEYFKARITKDSPQPEIYYFQGLNCDLEKLLAATNKNLLEDLTEIGISKENIVYYLEVTADHNEDPWRYVFNYFLDLHAQKSINY